MLQRHLLLLILILSSITTLGCSSLNEAHADRPPNIVIFFNDDMAYADVGIYGAQGYETPHLDKMAREGVRFTNFYVTQAVCSASRAGLLTGCYSNRVSILGALGPRARHGINPNEVTIAELCKQKGYATAIYGKWHLGHHKPFLPLQHGFDEFYGIPYSNDMWPHHPTAKFPPLPLFEGNEIINPDVKPKDQEILTTQLTERAVNFINKNKDKPFFVYLPNPQPHVPLFVSDKFKGKTKRGLFGDVISELDWSVGQVLKALKDNNLDEDTLVIFTCDNGPWLSYGDHAGSAGPLREGKGTAWDGGQREPCIMRWPGKIPPNLVQHQPAMTIDILPTIAKLIGAKLPDHKIDGKDIFPLMTNKDAKSPHDYLLFYWGAHLHAIRSGPYKLHFPHGYRTMAGRPGGTDGRPTRYSTGKTGLALYNLDKDIGEKNNIAEQHPEIVAKLKRYADEARKEFGDSAHKIKGAGVRPPGRLK